MREKRILEWSGYLFLGLALCLTLGTHFYYCTSYAYEGPPIWLSAIIAFFAILSYVIISLVNYGVKR